MGSGGRVAQPTARTHGGRVHLPPGPLHISLQKVCTAKPCYTLPPGALAVGLDSLPPGLLAVGTYPRQCSQTAAVPLRRTLPPWDVAVGCLTLPPEALAVAKGSNHAIP